MEQKLQDRGHEVFFVDPMGLDLPLLDKMYKEMSDPPARLKDLREKIKSADGYIAVSPEYNHSTSAAIKKTRWTISWKSTFSSHLR